MFMDLFPFLRSQCAGAVSAAGSFLIKINTGMSAPAPWRERALPAVYFAGSAGLFAHLNTNAFIPCWP
jgi:hypothetical protein